MEVSNTTAVTLTVDPSIVLATRDYVDSQLDEHERSTNHPDATLTQKGFTQLSNATDSDDETKAATPKAVKAAMIEARNHRHTWSQITDIPDGTLTQKGIVKLNNATDSNSTTEAATPSAVKAAYDLANSKAAGNHTHPWGQITGVPDGTLSQKGIVKLNNATDSNSTTEAATPSAVKAAMDKAKTAAPANHTHTSFYTTNGTFIVPEGVTILFVEIMGGGGGGAGGAQSSHYEACGGNAGELIVDYLNVAPGQHFSVKIGAGGNGGPFWNNPPVSQIKYSYDKTETTQKSFDGGDSSFSNLTAKGGHGGYNIYHSNTTQPYIKFSDDPKGTPPNAIPSSAEFYPGKNGENSIYGKGGASGTVITENLSNGGKKAVMAKPTAATGYGSGGAGGSYLPPFQYKNNELTNLGNTSGTKGASGFVKISW